MTQKRKYSLILLFVVVFFATRLPRLQNDIVNTDAPLWHERSEAFILALKTGDFAKTYQKYHPGVTLMWIAGASFEFTRATTDIEDTFRKPFNFEVFHHIAKVFVVLEQFGLFLIAFYALNKILGFNRAFFVVMLLALEPFFLANSRLLHLDSIFSLYVFCALLFSFLALREKDRGFGVLAGLLFAAAFLTKSIGIVALYYVAGIFILGLTGKKYSKEGLFVLASVVLSFAIFTYAMFPALWVAPVDTLTKLFAESKVVAIDKGHKQIFMGVETENPGALFYPMALAMKLSPFVLVGSVLAFFNKNKNVNLLKFLAGFYFLYFLIMVFATKKIDRYMLPIFPLFTILAVYGYEKVSRKTVGVLAGIFIILPIFTYFPHYFTYTSPIFGSAENASKFIGQKSFGVGVFDLRAEILERYGEKKVAMTDPDPLKEIYGSDKVFEISKANPKSYDLLILGPNVEFPVGVNESGKRFSYDHSLVINGIEFYRIYR